MQQFDVIVVGAGASGLMCAAVAGARGRRVCVLERTPKPGKKILMSGGGRCNFTNLYVEPSNFICSNPHFPKAALKRYTQWDFIAMVDRYGIAYHERDHGQLFCDGSSKEILAMLITECENSQVEIKTRCEVVSVTAQEGYLLETDQGALHCESLVVSTGGLSIPTLGGATGLGYQLAEQFGLTLVPSTAALVPFVFTDETKQLCESLSGISVPVTMCTGEMAFSEQLLFTHRGMSGPVVLQLSNYWDPGSEVSITFLPELDWRQWLLDSKRNYPKGLLRTRLSGVLPKKLVLALEQRFWPDCSERPMAELSDKMLIAIAAKLSSWTVKPSGTEGYRTAEVTRGGVDTDALSSKTMECKAHEGLYFIGEVVDVTGHLGGFNFQWAWSSGYSAGLVV